MTFRSLCALTLVLAATQSATAQTVRFDTNVGNIDIVLNPTGDPNLAVLPIAAIRPETTILRVRDWA